MRVLQLCNKIPFPPNDGGSIAMLNITQSLTNLGHSVSILAMDTSKHTFLEGSIPADIKDSIDFHTARVNTDINKARLISNLLFSSLPYNAQRFLSEEYSKELSRLLNHTKFDVVQLEGLYLTPYIPLIRRNSNAIISYRAHNIESEIWHRIYSNTRHIFRRTYLKILQNRLQRMEKNSINTYDVIVPISDRDGEVFTRWGNSKPMHISATGIIADRFRKAIPQGTPKKLFFIGSLDWIPNQEGINWLLQHIWPEIIKILPELEFHIAGRNAPSWLVDKLQVPGIYYHGEVDDAINFFDSHDLMIVPLFSGSGIRIKIIEAMARSKVVVTTPIGAEGLGINNSVHARIEENPKNFISAIENLCTHKDIFAEMSENAFVFARENFSNEKIAALLLDFYKEQLV